MLELPLVDLFGCGSIDRSAEPSPFPKLNNPFEPQASGGFIAPFINPALEWDFRLPLVKSINASGHKFGLVYAGVGWLAFREK